MDHICDCSSIHFNYYCSSDEIFDQVSTLSFACSSSSSNSFRTVHPFCLRGFTQYLPIQLYIYKKLTVIGGDYGCRIPVRSFCRRYNQQSHTAKRKDSYKPKGNEKHRTILANIRKENTGESGEVEAILSLLSEEMGENCRYKSKNTLPRIRSVYTWSDVNFMHNRRSSSGRTGSPARSDHESVNFEQRKKGIPYERKKKDYYSSENDQIIQESLNLSSYCSISSSDNDHEAQNEAVSSFNGTHRHRKGFMCQNVLEKEIIGGETIRDCEKSSRSHEEPTEKKRIASDISKVIQEDVRVGVFEEVNEITCLEKSLDNCRSSKSLEKTINLKRNPDSRNKIEERRTEIILGGSQSHALHPDIPPYVAQVTNHVQMGQKGSRNMDFEVKDPVLCKESYNNHTSYIEDVHVSNSPIIIGAGKDTPWNFDSTEETGYQSAEKRLHKHKSITSSMEQTEDKEEKIEPIRSSQIFSSTLPKEKHSSKMILEGKHGETFKLSSTLSSSSGKGGALPMQTFGGYSTSNSSSHALGSDSDGKIIMTDVHFAVDTVNKVHNDASVIDIHGKDILPRAGLVNERQHSFNQSVNNIYQRGEHDLNDSAGVHHTSTSGGPSTGENFILKRNGRSLWSVLADLVRLRWSSTSGSRNSNIRSCIGSLSTESVKSEEWFSVHEEQAENIHKNADNGGKKYPETDDIRNIEEVAAMCLGDCSEFEKTGRGEGDIPPSGAPEGCSTSRGSCSVYIDDNITYSEDKKSSGSTAFQSVSTSPPTPLSSIRRLIGFQIGGSVDSGTTDSSTKDSNEVAGFVGKESVLKQRRSKREKHVRNGSFGEWEEAYTFGTEQQRIDEMFMREALLESKKAADAWEVPVGAVLIRDGRIIARGCNLVEEKRDCTAHAEMICIREASNILNSWRLAGTTLYVTLEPCPMCAGAILQARVGTLVWGAPNKIIGADGSWIRLFPGDNGRREWEISEKPLPPVHPLHPNMKVRRLVLASECADTMQSFFQLRRRNKVKESEPSSPTHVPSSLYRYPSRILSKIHHVFHIFCV